MADWYSLNFENCKIIFMSIMIKQYRKENVDLKITDFELLDVSFYGCDARFEFEIRDKETGVLLDTDYETVENAFMGVDDGEEIYYFLEEKGIDFSEEYDDDYTKLPDELKKEFEKYEVSMYDDMYHEYLFDGDEETQDEYVEKIMKQLYLNKDRLYVIKGEEVRWISISTDYFGIHLHSDDVKISRVYNVDMESWIYEVEGEFFYLEVPCWTENPDYHISFFKRDDEHPHIVTGKDLECDIYPGYNGQEGDVLYDYYENSGE